MAIYKVEICGVNTSKLPLLTNEEKETLFEKIKEGDMEARETYIKGNLRLVLSVIQRFSGSNENVDDLFQIGCIGLIKAIDNFDITQPVRFSTYGVPMIVGEIRRYLRDNSAIRVSRSMRDTAYKVMQARERLMAQSQREPTVEQLAAEHFALADDVAKVSIVGAGMITNPGVAAKMFKCLYDTGFNIDMISTSEIKVSCILQKEGAKDAVRALHDSFGL